MGDRAFNNELSIRGEERLWSTESQQQFRNRLISQQLEVTVLKSPEKDTMDGKFVSSVLSGRHDSRTWRVVRRIWARAGDPLRS